MEQKREAEMEEAPMIQNGQQTLRGIEILRVWELDITETLKRLWLRLRLLVHPVFPFTAILAL